MPIPFMLIGALAILTFAVIANWNEFKKFMSGFIPKLVETLKTRGLRGVGILVCQKAKEAKAHFVHKTYYREHGKLYEEAVTREISDEKELPQYILDKLGPQEVDITNDYETHEKLSLSLG